MKYVEWFIEGRKVSGIDTYDEFMIWSKRPAARGVRVKRIFESETPLDGYTKRLTKEEMRQKKAEEAARQLIEDAKVLTPVARPTPTVPTPPEAMERVAMRKTSPEEE